MSVYTPDLLQESRLSSFADAAKRFFVTLARLSAANRCANEARRLLELPDNELAKRGLKRDQVILHTFRRYHFL